MDKFIDRVFDFFKGKNDSNVIVYILLGFFIYNDFDSKRLASIEKEIERKEREKRLELDKQNLAATIKLTQSIENNNALYKSIEKKNDEFHLKSLKHDERQLSLLIDVLEKLDER